MYKTNTRWWEQKQKTEGGIEKQGEEIKTTRRGKQNKNGGPRAEKHAWRT